MTGAVHAENSDQPTLAAVERDETELPSAAVHNSGDVGGFWTSGQLDLPVVLIAPEPRDRVEDRTGFTPCLGKKSTSSSFTAGNGVFPMFDSERSIEASAVIPGDVAGSNNTRGCEQGVIADDAVIECQAGALEPAGVDLHADTNDNNLGGHCGSVSQIDGDNATSAVRIKGGLETINTGGKTNINTVFNMDLRAYGTHLGTEGPLERNGHCFHKRDLKAASTAGGSDLSPDESGANDNHSARTGIEVGAQGKRIGNGPDNVYPAHPGGVGKSTGRRTSSDDESVVGDGLNATVAMLHRDNPSS